MSCACMYSRSHSATVIVYYIICAAGVLIIISDDMMEVVDLMTIAKPEWAVVSTYQHNMLDIIKVLFNGRGLKDRE